MVISFVFVARTKGHVGNSRKRALGSGRSMQALPGRIMYKAARACPSSNKVGLPFQGHLRVAWTPRPDKGPGDTL
ncbi:hypothetical protein PISMIDRAFT_679113 [Pisolithus microcarpus 441]|uniref:Uncharacterized protein n=1 Tax=Pisolithus microcarpus 441 TaxID=765257 RepID=A0A0C9YFK7_9AGAM|nr:hypothetical protein PISMIDRAFT_679113 [Pisolithus microcarpus 441]